MPEGQRDFNLGGICRVIQDLNSETDEKTLDTNLLQVCANDSVAWVCYFILMIGEIAYLSILEFQIKIRSEQLQHDYEMQQVEKAKELEAARRAEAKHNWLRVKITMRTKMIVDQFRAELKHPQTESSNERLVHNKRTKSRHTDELKNHSKEDESRQTDRKYSTRLSNAEVKLGKPVNRARVEFRSRPISVNPAEIVECKQRLLQLNQKRIPVANRKKTEAKMRLQWFHQKSAQLSQLCERQKQYQLRQTKAESKFNFFQTILQTIDKASVVLNHVRSLKANPMTIRKIANNMELKTLQMSLRNLAELDHIHKQGEQLFLCVGSHILSVISSFVCYRGI
ncbi:hypothetical protein P879_11144 [Paragonimus westermani]|uniref:Uncharacterized protein n=1 Tax=Paragonimus westermani TaxID=34504 RepID=A0A8T0DF20_9TREM|nr:hypothetical protein P879_11144 [Paragonimus westermani]